ncbi:substrate-binding domain-containing protein, partial [Staphylococcus aureus]|nr:substrate-binding domain-containing protein [Staphylococcus aureus]
MQQILSQPQRPTAVFCGGDIMAMGAICAADEMGLRVPQDVSVIGYDDTYESSFFYPALTTVSLDLDMQGKEAVRRLLEASESDASRLSSILPARLVIRHSTGPREDDAPDM